MSQAKSTGPLLQRHSLKSSEMSIFFKNFGPFCKLRTANWPIAWRKQTQPYDNLYYSLSRLKFSNGLYKIKTVHRLYTFIVLNMKATTIIRHSRARSLVSFVKNCYSGKFTSGLACSYSFFCVCVRKFLWKYLLYKKKKQLPWAFLVLFIQVVKVKRFLRKCNFHFRIKMALILAFSGPFGNTTNFL